MAERVCAARRNGRYCDFVPDSHSRIAQSPRQSKPHRGVQAHAWIDLQVDVLKTALSLGFGRILGGQFSERLHWSLVLSIAIVCSMLMVAFVLPQALSKEISADPNTLFGLPIIAFVFPLVGLFIAPIYPLLNSVVLSALPKTLHSPMSGLIVLFSATGGTLGSRITAYFFETLGGAAFYFTLVPMTLLLIAVFILRKLTAKA